MLGMSDTVDKIVKIISCLIEEFYIQALLDNNGGENLKEKIDYRGKPCSRTELIRLKTELLNNTWNPLSLQLQCTLPPAAESSSPTLRLAKVRNAVSHHKKDNTSFIKATDNKLAQTLNQRNLMRGLSTAATPYSGGRAHTMNRTFYIKDNGSTQTLAKQGNNKSFIS